MSEYVSEFVEESQEQITELNNRLLELERSPENEESMDAIFRIAHTLKGNCGAMGLARASELAHAIEDLLDAVRAGTVEVSPELMDAIFDGVDELEAMVDEVASDGEVRTDPTPTIETLRATLDDEEFSTPGDEAIDAVLEGVDPPAETHRAYFVRLAVDETDGRSGTLVVAALVDAFDLLATDPPREEIEAGEYGDGFDAVFGTPVSEDAIAAALDPVDVVVEFEIVDVTDRFDAFDGDASNEDAGELSTTDAAEMDVDELLDEFDEFDDLDRMVEDVEDVSAFEDMGDAGSFDDLLADEDEIDPGLEPGVPSVDGPVEGEVDDDRAETVGDDAPATAVDETDDPAVADEVDGDANAVFNELKDEVEQVEFDELQAELDDLEFDEYDEEEVGMDELLDDDVDGGTSLAEGSDGDEIDEVPGETESSAVEAEPSADDETGPLPDETADEVFAEMASSADDERVDETVTIEPSADEHAGTASEPESESDDESTDVTFQFGDVESADEHSGEELEPASESDALEASADADWETIETDDDDDRVDADDAPAAGDDDAETNAFVDDGLEPSTDAGWDVDSADDEFDVGSGFDETTVADTSDYEESSAVSDPSLETDASTIDDADDTDDVGEFDPPAASAGGFTEPEAGDDAFDVDVDLDDGGFDDTLETAAEPDAGTDETTPETEIETETPESLDESASTDVEPPEAPDISLPDVEETSTADDERDRTATQQSVRVDADQVDSLLTLVEGLVTSRVRLRHAIESDAGPKTVERELDDLEDITTELQETVMDIRLVPLQSVTNRLPRVVRDVARERDKEVSLEVSGETVELDRSILGRLDDPLIHVVRNAVDHGIEPPDEREAAGKPREGTVELRADRSRDRVTIEIEDDGSGLDPDRLRDEAVDAGVVSETEATELTDEEAHELIFHPGLSTAEEVTDVSGRGVGMDVVKRTIDELDGAVSVESEPGDGTTFTLTLPVTVAITDVLFVESGDETFGIPSKAIEDVETTTALEIDDGRLRRGDDEELPIVDLATALDTPEPGADDGMIVRAREEVRPVAIRCDEIGGQQEVVVKPFEGFMADIPGLSGATVRGRGEVVNILDVKTL
ncbi:ATP-binding protein [Natrialbaceae archaeon AArc-T1-2]|uniref:ATP-binding protein n=1 Tax=Natrialbaceae archaeon AArc-T1-2 TaxID=3053904 RepID=UPI00255ADCE4|nr:ATP-binding protein [Natrialbaceae archaeon AArc-T1-2]WIV67932.1 Hpt domain-containing protein [Natrialbaceae archaeon AArc-T1-2]